MSPKVQGGSAQTEDCALMRNIEFLMEQAILGANLYLFVWVYFKVVLISDVARRYRFLTVFLKSIFVYYIR